jgi:hypothetical protein
LRSQEYDARLQTVELAIEPLLNADLKTTISRAYQHFAENLLTVHSDK